MHRALLDGRNHLIEHIKSLFLICHNGICLPISPKANAIAQLIHVVDMFHPLAIHFSQQHDALYLPHIQACLFQLCALFLIGSLSALQQKRPDILPPPFFHLVLGERLQICRRDDAVKR